MNSTDGNNCLKELGFNERLLKDKAYQQKSAAYHDALEALKQTLSAEQEEVLKKFTDANDIFLNTAEYLAFKDGFHAGLRLGIDLFREE